MNINIYPDNRNPLTMPLAPTTYRGTHFSHGGIGGYVEVPTLDDLYNIPSEDGPSPAINPDGVTSGRRKIGMIVYVFENKKYYQLRPKFKDSKKEISWEVLNTIGNGFRGLLMNPLIPYGYCEDSTLNWLSLSGEFNNKNIPIEDFNSLTKYGYYDGSSLQDGYVVGTGNADDGVSCFGNLPEKEDPWMEVFIKGWEEKTNEFAPAIIPPFSPKRPVYFVADNDASAPAQQSDFNILSKDFDLSDGSVFGIEVGINTKRIVIAYPSAYGDLTRVIDSSTGFNIIGSFNKTTFNKLPPLSTDFTPPNADYDGLTSVGYNIYTSLLAVSYSSPTVYTITI